MSIHTRIGRVAKRKFQKLYIGFILDKGGATELLDEAAYNLSQTAYAGVPEYGYDRVSLWQRASSRLGGILHHVPELTPGARVLDLGAGDGILGLLLRHYGADVTLADMEDWRHPDCKSLELVLGKAEDGYGLPDGSLDCVVSFNTFEHLDDPEVTLNEINRLLKPGGFAYLDFGPLFCSPWGLHAYRSLNMPYPQFLFSEDFIKARLEELGINDLGVKKTELQPLNRWKPAEYERIFKSEKWECRTYNEAATFDHLDIVAKYPKAFQGRGLSLRDITASSILTVLRKV